MKQILIRTPEILKNFMQNEAKKIGITLNALVLQILWSWARKHGLKE